METIKKEHFEALFGIEADIEVVTLNPFEAFNLLHKEGKISDRDYQTIMDRFNTALINEFNSFSGLTSQQQFEISRATNELNRLSPQLEQLKQDHAELRSISPEKFFNIVQVECQFLYDWRIDINYTG